MSLLYQYPAIVTGITQDENLLKKGYTTTPMRPLIEHDVQSLEAELQASGHTPVHAKPVLRAYHAAAGSPNVESLPISRRLRSELNMSRTARVILRHESADGTIKLLLGFDAGGSVESVLMPSPNHRPDLAAGCVSSQIGCAMGCDFCASTRNGLERNLTSGEIVEQFLHLGQAARFSGRRLHTLVFMGMGEPLHNLDAVIPAIRRIADPDVGGLGWRQVTVSTVGIVPGIDRLADEDLNINLALSLHAPDDVTRARLVPSNRCYPVAEIMSAARRFLERTGRVPNIEYCVLAGVNDSDEQMNLLADLMTGFRAHVNLIPYNTVGAGLSGTIYRRPSPDRLIDMLTLLRRRNVVVHVRTTRGDDVSAACGQLQQNTPNPQHSPK